MSYAPRISFLKKPLYILGIVAYLNLIVAFTYVNGTSGSYITNPLGPNSDLHSYLLTIDYFREFFTNEIPVRDSHVSQYVLTRALTSPLMMFLSMIVGGITGNDAFAIIGINIIFYFLLVPILYKIGLLLFQNEITALIGSVLIITNWVLFTTGTTFLVDMGGWFFFLLTTMCALQYYRDSTNHKSFYLAIISSVVGVLFKEYGALGMATLGLLILIGNTTLKQKAKDILVAGLIFGSILVSYHLWFYFHFDYTYFSWYNMNYKSYAAPDSGSYKHEFSHLIRILVLIFLPGWPLFLVGILKIFKEFKNGIRENIYILLATLPASLAFLAWPSFATRITFIFIPWIAFVSAYGLSSLKNKWFIVIILLAYAVVNYNIDVLTTHLSFPW